MTATTASEVFQMNVICRVLNFICLLLATFYYSHADTIQAGNTVVIYQPSYQPATTLIDTLRPIYKEVFFSTEGQHIIIRGDKTVVSQIQELLLKLDHPAKSFQIEITNMPPASMNTVSYTTQSRNISQKRFTVTENIPLLLVREQHSRQLGTVGPLWLSVEIIPDNQEFMQISVKSAKDTVYVNFKLQTLSNGEYRLSSNQVSGPLGQWLAIGVQQSDPQEQDHWSTRHSNVETLYIKVTPVAYPG